MYSCGKLFKNIELAEFHGLKTGHENFAECTEEVKPLTAEEKVAQAERVKKLLTDRRLKRVQEEAEDAREKERQRIAAMKNLSKIKEESDNFIFLLFYLFFTNDVYSGCNRSKFKRLLKQEDVKNRRINWQSM